MDDQKDIAIEPVPKVKKSRGRPRGSTKKQISLKKSEPAKEAPVVNPETDMLPEAVKTPASQTLVVDKIDADENEPIIPPWQTLYEQSESKYAQLSAELAKIKEMMAEKDDNGYPRISFL